MIIEELIALLGFEMKGEQNLSRFQRGLDSAKQKLSAFAAAAARMAAAAGAAVGAASVTLAKMAISTGAEFESLRVQLEALEGSTQKAEAALDWIRQFAKDTPLDLQSTVKAYASLRNFGLDPTNGSLMALVDTMAMSGKGAEHLDGLVLALGQAWTKGKLQGEEALQLIERGVPVWDLLSKATGKTTEELIKLSSAGELGRDVIQLLVDQMGQRAAGASEKMAKTWEGITGRLADSWQQFKLAIADAGWFQWAKDQLEGLEAWIEGLWKSGTLDKLASRFSATFVAVGDSLMRFARLVLRIGRWIGRQFDNLGGLIADSLRNWTGGAIDLSNLEALAALGAALLAVFAPWTTALIAAFLVLDDLLAYLEGGPSVIGDWIDKLPDFTAALDGLAPGLGKAVGDAVSALKQGDWGGAGRAALDAFSAGWQKLSEAPYISAIKAEIGSLAGVIDTVTQPFQDFLSGISERIGNADFSAGLSSFADTFARLWDSVKNLGQGFLDLGAAINSLFSAGDGGDAVLASIGGWAEALGKLTGSAIIAGLEALEGVLNVTATAFDTLGTVLTKLSEGDLVGAWNAIGEGIIEVAKDIADTVEDMIQAFVPDFSFEDTWNNIKGVLDSFAAWLEGWVQWLNGILASIQWPEPPVWWQRLTGAYEDRRNASEAGRNVGAMVDPPKKEAPTGGAVAAPANVVTTPRTTVTERAAANNNDEGGNFAEMLAGMQRINEKLAAVTGDQAIEQTVNTVANDNRVTNVDVNAPVTINATTNASPQAIGAAAGGAVRDAGRDAGRSLAVTGGAGYGGPR